MPSKTAPEPTDAVAAYQFPSGHLGNLTPSQQTAFDQFKQLCVDRKAYSSTGSGSKGNLPSIDDVALLRFLRARRFDLEGAFKQFKETEDWRKENKIEKVYENIDREEYEETRRLVSPSIKGGKFLFAMLEEAGETWLLFRPPWQKRRKDPPPLSD